MWTTLRSEWIVNLLYVAATLTCLATGAPCSYFGKETCHYASPFLVISCSLVVFSLKSKQASFNLKKIFYNSQCLSLFSHDMGNLINVLRKRKHTTIYVTFLSTVQVSKCSPDVHEWSLLYLGCRRLNGIGVTQPHASWEQLPIDIQYHDWHIMCRSTYSMSINIHSMYVDRHTVCQLTYCTSIEIHVHQCMYADRNTVSRSTYMECMLIDKLYVNQHIICHPRYCMLIGCFA